MIEKENKQKVVMQQFTGTKTVKACEMSRKSAEEFIGRKIRADSDWIEDEAGYLVQYSDGYTSWSPKKMFEESYRVSETYVDRMVIEHEQLKERYLNGRAFSFSEKFRKLDDEQKRLLCKQLNCMEEYLYCLGNRIVREKDELAKGIVEPHE